MAFEDRFFNDLRRMQKSLNRFFSDFDSDFYEDDDFGPLDIREESLGDYRRAVSEFEETQKEYFVEIELPGMNKEDIDIDVKNHNLEIKAKHKQEKSSDDSETETEESSGRKFYAKSFSGFYQSVTLPEDADPDKIEAEYKNGILHLKIPKKQDSDKDKGKYIKIR